MMTIKQLCMEILRIIVFVLVAFALSFTIVNTCFSQTTFLSEGFENTDSLSDGWTAYDEDGDGYLWNNYGLSSGAHSGDRVLFSPTSMTATGVASNNWLVTPEIDLTSNAILSFWCRSHYTGSLLEDMNILISVTGNTPADFTIVLDSIRDIPQEYTQHIIDLNAYTGQQVYIAFQVVSKNKQVLAIDDIDVSGDGDVWPEIEITSPAEGTKIPIHDTVLISMNPTVSEGTIDSVLLYINDSLWHTFRSDSIYDYEWNTNDLALINYTIKAYAYNDRGHYAVDEIVVHLYDLYPICDIVHPAENASIFIGTIIPIVATTEDTDTVRGKKGPKGGTDIYFYIDDSLHYVDSDYPYTYNWDTKGYGKGSYKIEIVAKDEYGNQNFTWHNNNHQMFIYLVGEYTDDRIEWNNIYENVSTGMQFFINDYISTEISTSIIQSKDSTYVIAGYSNASDFGQNGYLLKLNNKGDTLWTQFYEVSEGYLEYFNSVTETFDANGASTGYVAVGLIDEAEWTTTSDILVIKTDIDGNQEWVKAFTASISTQNEAMSVKSTNDGGCIVVGYQGITNGGAPHTIVASNAWLIKLDADGNEEWNKTYGDDKYFDFASDVVQTSDDGFVFTGYSITYSKDPDVGFADAWFCKIDKDGNEEWNKTYGGDLIEIMYSIDKAPNNGFIAAGISMSHSGDSIKVGWVLRLDESGDTLWTKTYGGEFNDNIKSIKCTHDNNFIACGFRDLQLAPSVVQKDAWVFKIDWKGDVIWDETYGSTDGDEAKSVIQTFDGGYILAGNTNSFGMGSGHGFGYGVSIWVIKIKSDEFMDVNEKNMNNNLGSLSNYPNPCSNGSYIVVGNDVAETVNLTVWNADGKLITTLYDGNMPAGENTIYFDTQNLENGLYFYKLQSNKGIITKKLIKL